jgi:uncharacterized protein (DUF433 family)
VSAVLREFALIEYRQSAAGRQACVKGSSLAVWEIALLLRSYKGNAAAVAAHLEWPEGKVEAAIHYVEAHPGEIGGALKDNDAVDFATLQRMLPEAMEVTVNDQQ